MNNLRDEAEKLRANGYSYSMITEHLGIAKSTMSYWFRDKSFTPNPSALRRKQFGPIKSARKRHNQRVADIERINKIGRGEVGKLSQRDLWMLGLGLYIGEGSKSIESIRIINSDPMVIITAIKWFKESCNLKNENIKIRLHIYPDTNPQKAVKYWQSITKLPANNFYPAHVDMRENKNTSNRRKLPNGTAHLCIVSRGDPQKGVALYRKIEGWMSGALDQV